jgi:23S rRNA A2030 N6-methylase RlmJ
VNVQDGNVGNRGDVLKHVALVELAALLRARNPGGVRHVETHTFRLDAPLSRAWSGEGRYGALEAPWVARGRYRCSAGLVADVLGPVGRLALAEAHPETRAALAAAVAAEGLVVDALVDEAFALGEIALPPMPLLVHVDPFDHARRYWPLVERLLATWRRPEEDAVVLAFAYDKTDAIAWPEAPAGLVAIGRRDDRPYGVAAWASPGIAEAARAAVGWPEG